MVKTQFAGRTILFFTEYKATQAMLMSALIHHFGNHCVTFINGDNRIDGVIDSSGQSRTLSETRSQAATKFNAGQVRFLVSTEAGGEGIDLQQNCHTLVHVDLPWNPMRLHQRVGRLNRYGQTKAVEVITLRNPDTVESLIWEKLNDKIHSIMQSQHQVMEDPEDLLQLVLGMTTPSLFQELFSDATHRPQETLSQWFDQKTAQFGGHDALETVKNLVGNYARFDFQKTAHQIPPLDLPDLEPFFTSMLIANRRQVRREESGLSFITPDSWRKEIGVRDRYDELKFDRHHQQHKILGMGHKLMQQAIHQAKDNYQPIALLPPEILDRPLLVFRVTDRITGQKGLVKTIMVGVLVDSTKPFQETLLLDWQLLQKLNSLTNTPNIRRIKTAPANTPNKLLARTMINQAEQQLSNHLSQLNLPFKIPTYSLMNVLWVG